MGNMLTDSRKGLEFSYNLANLPESVEGADGASLTYSYLSDGSKWRASANDGPSILYRGSFVYENDGTSTRISSIAWDEGRISYHDASAIDSLAVVDSLEVELGEIVVVDTMAVDIVEDGICDEWHVRDHLGSVRAIAGIGNYITGVRELNTYLPFGTRIPGSIQATDNRHRFGGKEEQRYGSFSLGLSDFGARYYDPFTCRWTTRDPLAGKYLSLSPYNYCAGNPVNLVDPDGQDAIYIVFPDYKANNIPYTGHAGVLLIDNKSGYTKYYEYGRYDGDKKGHVRSYSIPNVKMKDGKPTAESLDNVLSIISSRSGHSGRIEGAYVESDDFTVMNEYATERLKEHNDDSREPYKILGNNCGTFADDVISQDSNIKTPSYIIPSPIIIGKKYQNKYSPIHYEK